ncbi:ANTAR domain-containing protein [Cellulomonas sp.]|uniref:ANTAR domain-containing protein n=1 Tax=Cellulomonas sp. TaxID=40001 RepID=UPI001B15D8C7|nr:ANTAR domain-containing protein [Cellulomonas sp.]MBO9555173.1 ANTAR domain-containing protein [Cellulomonas sp.]
MDPTVTAARFHHPVAGGRSWWSDELYTILGMSPGDVPPRLDVLLRHVRADERASLEQAVDACASRGRSFAQVHTVTQLRGTPRTVTIAAVGFPAHHGTHEVDGVVVDVSGEVAERAAQQANIELVELLARRGAVEQSVGVLGLVYGVDRTTALERLRRAARQRQVDVAGAAEAVVSAAQAVGGDLGSDQAFFERAVSAAVERPSPDA